VSDHAAPRILAVANQKGGVGKTTTAINLGTALAAVGEKVLVIDLDPQGNASTGLGVERKPQQRSSYHVLIGEATLKGVIKDSGIPNLHCAPATMDLLGAELELAELERKTHRLTDAIAALTGGIYSTESYSYILIDCPPSLNLLTINALTAADAVLVPLQCEFFALEGLSQLLKTVERVKNTLNARLTIQGVVLTMFDKRNSLSEQVAEDVRGVLGEKVYQTVIPRNVRISEAPSYGKPVLIYDHTCTGSQAYIHLASEVIQRERDLKAA
jgi:chromosome partitioning protein